MKKIMIKVWAVVLVSGLFAACADEEVVPAEHVTLKSGAVRYDNIAF